MIAKIALDRAAAEADGPLRLDGRHRWTLTPEELDVAELLFTAPSLAPFAGALDSTRGTLALDKLKPMGSGARTTFAQQVMLRVTLSIVTTPDVACAYEGYDPGTDELTMLPDEDLQVALEAITLKAQSR